MENTAARKRKQVPEGYLIVGVDPHKRRHATVAITQDFTTRDKFKFDNTREGLEMMLDRVRVEMVKSGCRGVMFAIETGGHYWRNVAYFLDEQGVPFRLINQFTLKRRREGKDLNRRKNDYRDGEVAAQLLCTGEFTESKLPQGVYAELVDPPSPRKKPMRTLTPSEVEFLLDTAKDSYYYPIIYTAVSTGLRQAELLGLRWRDIDLDMLSISVSQVLYKRRGVCQFKEPKTAHSRRRVSMTPKLALFLRQYCEERERLYRQLGKELTLDDLVFTSVNLEPLNPSVLTHNFAGIVKKAGLEATRFHDLRHSFASLMLLRGAKPKVISEALGHSSVAFTMDVYSHIIEGMQSDAMALLDEVLPPGKNGVKNKINANLTPEVDITAVKTQDLASSPCSSGG